MSLTKRDNKEYKRMPDYSKSKIYKLVSPHTEKVYIGSTIQPLYKRKGSHKSKFQAWKNGTNPYNLSSFRLFEFGIDDVDIVLIENCPCSSIEELHAKECEHIKKQDCVNKCIPTRTYKQYYEDNKEKKSARDAAYYQANKEAIDKKRNEKIVCEICKSTISKKSLPQHKKTTKHIAALEAK